MACPKIWNKTSIIFSRLPSAVPLWRHDSTPDSWSGGESSCHGTLYSFWSWILQCLASELRHGCPGRIWPNMCVFFVLGNIPRNIPAGILRWWEFLGISSESVDVKGSNRAVWSPKFLVNHWVVCGCEERTGAQTPSTMPCPSLIQSTITSKSHLNVQWSKLKTNIYGKSSICVQG